MTFILCQDPICQGSQTKLPREAKLETQRVKRAGMDRTKLKGATVDSCSWYKFRLIISRFFKFEKYEIWSF